MIEGLITLVIVIAILGLIVWAITSFIPMAEPFKKLIYVICGIVCLLILLRVLTGGSLNLHLGGL